MNRLRERERLLEKRGEKEMLTGRSSWRHVLTKQGWGGKACMW